MSRTRKVKRIIGLMSGTSHDGVDAALVEISNVIPAEAGIQNYAKALDSRLRGNDIYPTTNRLSSDRININLVKHIHTPYNKPIRETIRKAFNGNTELICRLNFTLGGVFANAVLSLLKESGFRPSEINAIASHGQTIYHIPPAGNKPGSTLQIGEASVIAERTGILTISDFRTADMAAGGHGAPLVPMADYLLFRKTGKVKAILNIGGIANVTIVSDKIDDTVAFDIGPGNSLIDEAMRLISRGKKSFDKDGAFARSGEIIPKLLKDLFSHPHFKKRPPKSTGRETFGAAMVKDIFKKYIKYKPQDIVSTLTHVTAITIHNAIIKFRPDELILTGGGINNVFLVELINNRFRDSGVVISNISSYGIPPQAKEAISFAIIGYLSLNRRHGNIRSVTGAKHGVILGKLTLLSQPTIIR